MNLSYMRCLAGILSDVPHQNTGVSSAAFSRMSRVSSAFNPAEITPGRPLPTGWLSNSTTGTTLSVVPVMSISEAAAISPVRMSANCVNTMPQVSAKEVPRGTAGWVKAEEAADFVAETLAEGPFLLGDRFSAADNNSIALFRLGRKGFPIVALGPGVASDKPDFDCITSQVPEGLKEAMQHLVEMGHREIAYFGPLKGVVEARLQAYRTALARHKIKIADSLSFRGETTLESGFSRADNTWIARWWLPVDRWTLGALFLLVRAPSKATTS